MDLYHPVYKNSSHLVVDVVDAILKQRTPRLSFVLRLSNEQKSIGSSSVGGVSISCPENNYG